MKHDWERNASLGLAAALSWDRERSQGRSVGSHRAHSMESAQMMFYLDVLGLAGVTPKERVAWPPKHCGISLGLSCGGRDPEATEGTWWSPW